MQFTVTCACGKKLAAREEHVGKRAKCPRCGQLLLIARPAGQRSPQNQASDTLTGGEHHTPGAAPESPAAPRYNGQLLEHWFNLLTAADANDRRQAAEVLGGVGPEAVGEINMLIAHTARPHVLVRHWATVCLGQIGPQAKDALDALLARLQDEQPLVREKAAHAIGQVIPGGAAFVPRLLGELNRKDADHSQAIEVFRRDLKTAGISRFRYWACACGRVYIKVDLEERLRNMVEAPHEMDWTAVRACAQCGAKYEDRDIYDGKYDVDEPYWPKLRVKFGNQLALSDDFFDETKQDVGYRLSNGSAAEQLGMPSPAVFSLNMETAFAVETNDGYALAAAPVAAPPLYERLAARVAAPKKPEWVPGGTVPETGKYKCVSCAKRRLSGTVDTNALVQPSVIVAFRAGKEFTECPRCGELTEWERVR